jgi:myo-inositol-1(or 4)-monophosphatase
MARVMSPSDDGPQGRPQVAERVITEAGGLALDYFARIRTLRIDRKGARDLVSEADVEVESLIRRRLESAFPEDGFLGEESGFREPGGDAGLWVVDPIDGTQPFLSGLRTWCVSIAYLAAGRVRIGLVLNPPQDELFAGGVSQPATLNGQPIEPHPGSDLTDGLVFLGASPRVTADQVVPVLDRLMRAGGMYVRNGSGALGLCDVACGRLLGFVEPHINAWDCLGAIGVLESAGCRVNDYLVGDSLHIGNEIVAGPPAVFDRLDWLLHG